MPRYEVGDTIAASPERLWALLADWEGSQAWMVDATTVEVLGEQREGVGTRVRAVTRIAGISLVDEMTVTRWEQPRLIVVRHHRAPIRGIAWWEIVARDGGAVLRWVEEIDPPLGPLGEAGGVLLRRAIERTLRKSLVKLKALAERR